MASSNVVEPISPLDNMLDTRSGSTHACCTQHCIKVFAPCPSGGPGHYCWSMTMQSYCCLQVLLVKVTPVWNSEYNLTSSWIKNINSLNETHRVPESLHYNAQIMQIQTCSNRLNFDKLGYSFPIKMTEVITLKPSSSLLYDSRCSNFTTHLIILEHHLLGSN